MDGVSAAASVAQLVFMTGNVLFELKKFYESTKTIQETVSGLIKDVQGLAKVLTCMHETLSRFSKSQEIPELASYWFNVNNALQDGNTVLQKLQELLQAVDRPGKVLEKGRKKLRFDTARPQIDLYRQHVQSYRDILQLCLQTIIFWNQMVDHESTNTLIVGLDELHKSVHQNACQMNEVLSRLENLATSQPGEVQIEAMGRLRECVKSVAGIVTTASTMVSPDRTSTILPSEFDVYFPEDRNYMLSRLLEDGEAASNPKSYVDTPDMDESDNESESDSELEFEINRLIIDDSIQLLADDKIPEAEKLLQDRLSALEERKQPGAPVTVKYESLYREIQLSLASLLLTKGDFKSADRRAHAALKGFKKLGNSDQELACLRLLASIAKAKGADSYYDAYLRMCARLEGTRPHSLTLDNLASLAPSISLVTSRTASPRVGDGDDERVFDAPADPNTTHDTSNNTLRLPRAHPSMTTLDHRSVASYNTGPYEDAPEYPDIGMVMGSAKNIVPLHAVQVEKPSIMSQRQQSTTASSDTSRDSHPKTLRSSRSSIDMQSERSTALTSPTEASALSFHRPTNKTYTSDSTAAQARSKMLYQVTSSSSGPGPSPVPFRVQPESSEKPALPTLLIHNPTVFTAAALDYSNERALSGGSTPTKPAKQPRVAPGGGWSRSGYIRNEHSVDDDATSSKRGLFGKKFKRKSSGSMADATNARPGGDGPPRLPEMAFTSSPTGSSIEKNWVQVSREETETSIVSPAPTSPLVDTVLRKRKVICVGDSGVGKTLLLARQRHGEWHDSPSHKKTSRAFPTMKQDQPTLSPPCATQLNHPRDRNPLELTAWDTPGQAGGYELMRQQSYPDSNVVLVCFAVDDRTSLANVESLWHPEIRKYCPGVPVILVGCKSDLHHTAVMSSGEAEAVRKRIGASVYLECSAVTGQNITRIFEYICVLSCASNKYRQNSTERAILRRATDVIAEDEESSTEHGKPSPMRRSTMPNP